MNKSNFPRYLWKQRRSITALLLLATIFLSIGTNPSQFNLEQKGTELNELNLISSNNLEVDDPWFSSANNKPVKTYIQNTSQLINQVNSFNITAPAAVLESKIHSANLSFNFESNYNTSYILEDDSPLDYPIEAFTSRDNIHFSDTFYNETGDFGVGGIIQVSDGDVDPPSYADVFSTSKKVIVNYTANFSSVSGFDRSDIIGLRFSFVKDLDLDVTAQIYIWNFRVWALIVSWCIICKIPIFYYISFIFFR